MSASSQHLYAHDIMKFTDGDQFHSLKYACGLAHTSLSMLEKWLNANTIGYVVVKSEETLDFEPDSSAVIFISTQSFFRSLPSVKNRISIVLDGMLKLVESQGLPILDADYSCIQQVATRWTPLEPDLTPLLNEHPKSVSVRARRINFGLLTLTAATNDGLYQKLLTLIENNSDPTVQRAIADYISKIVYQAIKEPTRDKAIAHISSLSSENMTRAAFIEKLVDAVLSPYGQKISKLLRDNKETSGNDLWDMEDVNGLMRGDLFLTQGILSVPA